MVNVLLIMVSFNSCEKLVEVNAPVTSTNALNVFANDATAIAVLTGIYTNMSATGNDLSGGFTNISTMAGLSADEFELYGGVSNASQTAYYTNSLSSKLGGYEYWNIIYPYIFKINSAIEGLNSSTGLTFGVKQQLIGEAKFMRALFYFYLTNLYNDVPLVTTTDYKENKGLSRTSSTTIYQQIITDLKDAQNLLSNNYLDASAIQVSSERVRPNKSVATALLARVYLYSGDWVNAETQASDVINNTKLYDTVSLDNVFLKNSIEAIWQLQPVKAGQNTDDAIRFIIPSNGPSNDYPVYLSNNILNSFEPGDLRKSKWIDSVVPAIPGNVAYYFPYKYKATFTSGASTEYLMIFRLAEQYLIRSEARAKQNNISGAQSDLNIIRFRAGLPTTAANDKESLISAILHERQVELFSEWGHRWLDLKRANKVDDVMAVVAPQKGGTWNTNWKYYPIPLTDIQMDLNLKQNPGY